jgi:hypothetical protein
MRVHAFYVARLRIPAIAITRFGASRSERSDVSLGV